MRVVVAGPVGAAVSAAVGQISDRAPSPANPTGRVAVVFNVVTLPAHRGRGYAGACLDEALAWVDARGDVPVCELVATADGMALYQRRGFAVHEHPLMRRHRTGATGSA